jgi:hypothetical protein
VVVSGPHHLAQQAREFERLQRALADEDGNGPDD